MRIQRQRDYNRLHPLLKIGLGIVLVVGVSFCLAWVWHTTEFSAAMEEQSLPLREPFELPVSSEPEIQEPEPKPEPEEPSSSPELESSGEMESSVPDSQVLFPDAVPPSDPVGADYFDDAIFFGDSITTGIPLYHIADNAAVVAMTGINPENINYKECIEVTTEDGAEQLLTVLEAARLLYGERNKIYIMLGGNGTGYDKETFISNYKRFLDSVKAQYPGATIYLQSMTPVVEGYQNRFDPGLNNDKIDEYNLEIMALAKREKVFYLDVASALKDETGALPKEASPVDGMHFQPEYYMKWFDYLKTHTV